MSNACLFWLQGCLATFLGSSLLCLLAILRSVEYYPEWEAAEGELRVTGNAFVKFQKFPRGGDEIPVAPAWDLPAVPIATDPAPFLASPHLYVTANFSLAPGLGNIMFQYASLLGLAKRLGSVLSKMGKDEDYGHNATLLLPESALVRRSFAVSSAQIVSDAVSANLSQEWWPYRLTLPDCCRYYSESSTSNASFYLGYIQSWRYFEEAEKEVRRDFALLPIVREKSSKMLNEALHEADRPPLSSDNSTLIGVHVRRGMDVTWNARNLAHGHVTATPQYLLRAISDFRTRYSNATFVVVSDNGHWARQHLKGPGDIVFLKTGARETDLGALTLCQHTIMSTGTFSWWAAYLAGGDALYYAGWPRSGSQMDKMTIKAHYFLPKWEPMS